MAVNDSISQLARSALQLAGSALLDEFRTFTATSKKSGHEITISQDRLAEGIIVEKIKQTFPHHNIVSEEIGGQLDESEYCWIIDPLEGTTNYAAGLPYWATQLAIAHKNELIHAGVNAPIFGEYYWATKDCGAWMNTSRLAVSSIVKLSDAHVRLGRGSQDEHIAWWGKMSVALSKSARTVRLFGATGLELAYVAGGHLAAHLNFGSKVTDYASGALLVREAGGVVKTFDGKDWTLGDTTLIAGNTQIVTQLIDVINSNPKKGGGLIE